MSFPCFWFSLSGVLMIFMTMHAMFLETSMHRWKRNHKLSFRVLVNYLRCMKIGMQWLAFDVTVWNASLELLRTSCEVSRFCYLSHYYLEVSYSLQTSLSQMKPHLRLATYIYNFGLYKSIGIETGIIRTDKSRRLRWATHVARIGKKKNVCRILSGEPEERDH
jgi:hypothetical protein